VACSLTSLSQKKAGALPPLILRNDYSVIVVRSSVIGSMIMVIVAG
jgi:hypothetical protein